MRTGLLGGLFLAPLHACAQYIRLVGGASADCSTHCVVSRLRRSQNEQEMERLRAPLIASQEGEQEPVVNPR